MTPKQTIRLALEQAMRHATEPMGLSDPDQPDNPMVAVNAAFEKLTGYPAAEVVGRNCRFLQGPSTDPGSAARIRACLDADQGCIEWIVNHRSNGASFWNLLFISPVRGPDGDVLFFFANQMDAADGLPERLAEFPLGPARMSRETETAFHAMLQDVLSATEATPGALDRIVAAARQMAVLSTRLEPDDPS